MAQYAFNLSLPPVFSADNFCVSGCNDAAWRWIEIWPGWPANALLLIGPEGSGKSHLGAIWAQRARAPIVPANRFASVNPATGGNWLIEDIDRIMDERGLLHLLNYNREHAHFLLLTSCLPPAQLPFTLRDLTSRLLALPVASLEEANDEVLGYALRKQLADRQLKVGEEVIAYLLPRMERSLSKVKLLVESMDKAALAEQRQLTIPFVKRLLF